MQSTLHSERVLRQQRENIAAQFEAEKLHLQTNFVDLEAKLRVSVPTFLLSSFAIALLANACDAANRCFTRTKIVALLCHCTSCHCLRYCKLMLPKAKSCSAAMLLSNKLLTTPARCQQAAAIIESSLVLSHWCGQHEQRNAK